ncbi:DMT family transporter [Achromobacter seleniivolatilans]|uniref:DMT family transporter n=1 Tax=Achromobacter seleniivolatilans TaxID=3047478 RepID=A0ABY9M4Y7_9BURK|nr:DMT family transporter [Achromobacter sp. R39]WMD22059.1 DMT family transporter [Achromobacter sp. R39]
MNSATLFAIPAAIIAGALVPIQAGANAALGRNLGHPLWATMASLAISAVAAMIVMALLRVPAPSFAELGKLPWWGWTGGVAGVFYITAGLILAPRLGAGAFLAAVIAGQMLAALVLDRYALVGFLGSAMNPGRLAGAALIMGGALLMHLSTAPRAPA